MYQRQALVRDVTKLLLELGTGFAFLGNQYHLNLRCYVVIELKTGDFKPEYAGQLNFYLSAVTSENIEDGRYYDAIYILFKSITKKYD